MKIIEQLENILDKRNEYLLSLYEQKLQKQDQLSQLKVGFDSLQEKMVLSPSVKIKAKLDEKRKGIREDEEQLQNIEIDIKDFENSIFDLAPYKQTILDEFRQEIKENTAEQIDQLKQAKKDYEAAAATVVESVQHNRALISKIHLVLNKTRQNLEEVQIVMGNGEEGYFTRNIRSQKINEYLENQLQRIQSQLTPLPLLDLSVDREDIEPKSVFHYEFLGQLI